MIQIEQIRNYFPVQIRGNSGFDKHILKRVFTVDDSGLPFFYAKHPKDGFYRWDKPAFSKRDRPVF